jgi:hypothetical protein
MVSPVVCGRPAAQRVVPELPPASDHPDAVGKIAFTRSRAIDLAQAIVVVLRPRIEADTRLRVASALQSRDYDGGLCGIHVYATPP